MSPSRTATIAATPVTAAMIGPERRISQATSAPAVTRNSSSAPVASAGRVRCAPDSICSSAWAWISTPGTEVLSGVARRSKSPVALAPIRICRPATSFGSKLPSAIL